MTAYLPLMWSILRRRFSLTEEEAEDTIGQAWTVIFKRTATMPGPDRRVAWLASIVCWTARGVIRVRRDEQASADLLEQLPQPGENAPDEVVADMETGSILRAAIRTLSPRDQVLLTGKYLAGAPLSHAELADRIGVTANSIGPLLGRALKRLEKELRARGLDPPDQP